MLHTKLDYINCLEKIISNIKPYYTPGCAGLKCGDFGAYYDETGAMFEGFSRIL